jgi:hypothetical protein
MLVLLLSGGRVWGNGWVDSYRQEYKVLRLGVNSTTGPVNKCAHTLPSLSKAIPEAPNWGVKPRRAFSLSTFRLLQESSQVIGSETMKQDEGLFPQ